MTLDFLGGIGGLTQAASGIGGILGALGIGKPKMNYGPTPSEAQANSLFQALLDPNNSLVKQNTDINMQEGMHNLLMQLKQMQMMGARGQARGLNNVFFSPERADETLNYLLTRGQPAIAADARTRATNDIRSTASSLQDLGRMEQERRNAQQTNAGVDYQNSQMQGGYGGMASQIGGGLQDFLKVLMPQNNSFPWQAAGNINPSGGYY